jgi:virulence factor Mce-like protein
VKRLLAIAVLLAAGALLWLATTGARGDDAKHYKVELDNAFGLIEGGDVKIAGVRAGTISDIALDRSDMRALVTIEVTRAGFGDLRRDAFCEAKAQSLIGEYFLDCTPGKGERMPENGTVPVEQTGTVVPVDLVNNIYRRPYRERFSIILQELGAGLAARGPDLNAVIRRANPALREVDKVLAILAEQRYVIRNLYRDADVVIGRLADNRKNVTRFVAEARDTARTVATRDDELRAQYQTFPTFLREFRPTIKLLGDAAERQAPALRTLRINAPLLQRFLATVGPFSEVSRPAFRSLAGVARQGRPAIRNARPRLRELGAFTKPLPEVADNLAITLEHLDDPKFAVEKDVRAGRGPNGGFTGLEALLRYFFAQSQAINLFDANSYFLKVSAFVDRPCANYTDAAGARDPATSRCRAWLGPNQPGVTSPDFTAPRPAAARATRRARRRDDPRTSARAPHRTPGTPSVPSPGADPPRAQAPLQLPPALTETLDGLLGRRPATPPPQTESVLDFLLGS